MNLIKKFKEWRDKQDGYLLAQKWEEWASGWMPYAFLILIPMLIVAIFKYVL